MLQTLGTDRVPCAHPRTTTRYGKRRDRIDAALSFSRTSITLDELLAVLDPDEEVAYAIVANAVRDGRVAVEFDGTGRSFPYRDLIVRRL